MTMRSSSLCSLRTIRLEGCWLIIEVRQTSYIGLPTNESWTRSTSSSLFTFVGFGRMKVQPLGIITLPVVMGAIHNK